MSTIRRQSIISSVIIFIGFAIGFANNLIFTREGIFTVEQYGLTRSFFDFGQVIFGFSFLGVTAVMYKFYPYYKSHLPDEKNDLLTWVLLTAVVGFFIFLLGGVVFQSFFIRKFSGKSPLLVNYYYWLYPFGLSLMVFLVLESYCWSLKRTIITNFLKEAALRIITGIFIILFLFKVINYDVFIKLFTFLYTIVVFILLIYLKRKKQLHFTFKASKVTRRLRKRIITYALFIFAGTLVATLSATIDSIIISSLLGQASLGVFALSSYISNLIQIPQRSVSAISIPVLSEAWKNKDYQQIDRIYKRSSLNLLLAGLFIFGNIWLNFENAIYTFDLNPAYLAGKQVAFFLACKLIVDMGTGVNGQIIITSNYWRFEFLTGVILLLLIAPLNYLLIKELGIVGSAISNFSSYTIYNLVRLLFLWKKFKMQPFTINTLWAFALCIACYFIAYALPETKGLWGIIIKSSVFSIIFIIITWKFKLTPDFEPVLNTLKKRMGFK
ncbi:MAG TPA: polysaccharide biosynthesis C-terminal domain-containing protein [Chitinophagaceae bacterium]|nr:polysaccharide biosynthesis C-terminal domain-containing protein [Chitinophagaceae bacterium]